MSTEKKLPNILICGTPGCGKTQHAARLKELLEFQFFNVSEIVKEKQYYESFDEVYQSYLIDEDRLLDELEGPIAEGGCVIDHHTCDFFPERFFQLVVVLRTNNDILFDRLTERGYNEIKLQENLSAEIMEVVKSSAEDSYAPEVVVELTSNTPEELEANVQRIIQWVGLYMSQDDGDDGDDDGDNGDDVL
jgi:adenylate kinase